MRYVDLGTAPLWENCLLLALSVALTVWRTGGERNPVPRFLEPPPDAADKGAVVVALRFVGVAVVLWVAYWQLVTRVH